MSTNKSDIVRSAFRDIVKNNCPDNFDELPIAQLGIDSLDFFEMLIVLEEEHGIDIPVEKLDNDLTVKQLLSSINE